MDTPPPGAPPAAITERSDPPRGVLNTGWPLAALALMLLMLMRACIPTAPPAAPPAATPVYGEADARPLAGNAAEAGRCRNRRIESATA